MKFLYCAFIITSLSGSFVCAQENRDTIKNAYSAMGKILIVPGAYLTGVGLTDFATELHPKSLALKRASFGFALVALGITLLKKGE